MSLVDNKKTRFNYDILDTFEAGIELEGSEVKSLRSKHGSLDGAHVSVRGRQAYLLNATIPPYQPKNTPESYDPMRPRRLLLSRKELTTLEGNEMHKGLTIVPLSIYNKGRVIKLSIAVARGKKKHDKRETLKKRESDRDIARTLKNE